MDREEKDVAVEKNANNSAVQRKTAAQRAARAKSNSAGRRTSSAKRSTGASSRKKSRRSGVSLPPGILLIAVCVIVVLLVIVLVLRGCGGTFRSPQNVAKALVTAGVEGKAKTMKSCYGITGDTPSSLQSEIDATIAYYKAHGAKDVKIVGCDTLFNNQTNAYVYVTYNLVLENDQEYPCVTTYMTRLEDKKNYVLPSTQITDEMRSQAEKAYEKFMTGDAYKTYAKAYDTFIKKNPGYEERIIGKLG